MTEVVQVPDDAGDELALRKYNGCLFPVFPTDELENIAKIKVHSNDIFVCAYPKSGTHWIWEIIRLLLLGKLDDTDVAKASFMIEMMPESSYKDAPSPRILNSHVLYENLPEEAREKKVKIVYTTRNPKDVMVSFYNFKKNISLYRYNGKWENYLKPQVEGRLDYGSWFDYVKDWERVKKTTDARIFTVNYEDMKEDMVREAKKLMSFLEVDRSDDFVRKVCEQTEFGSMKKLKGNANVISKVVYRKGQVGDWKNWFTVAQNEWFDAYYADQMKDCPLKFRFTLD